MVVAIVVAAIVVIGNGGSTAPTATRKTQTSPPTSTTTAPTTTTTATNPSTTTATTPQLLAALNLTSPVGETQTVGVVQVIRVGGTVGIVVAAQGVPANSTHNAYAIWLYNSSTSYERVGFITNLVGKSGKFATQGRLPSDAAKYDRILITLETQDKPTHPGEVVLSGPFREHQ